MQPAIVVTGVRASRLVRVPCEVANELDAEAVFVAANRIESPIKRDLANLTAKWQRDLRINLDRFGAPSMAPADFEPNEARRTVHRILDTGAERLYLTHFGELSPPQPAAGEAPREQLRSVSFCSGQ